MHVITYVPEKKGRVGVEGVCVCDLAELQEITNNARCIVNIADFLCADLALVHGTFLDIFIVYR